MFKESSGGAPCRFGDCSLLSNLSLTVALICGLQATTGGNEQSESRKTKTFSGEEEREDEK